MKGMQQAALGVTDGRTAAGPLPFLSFPLLSPEQALLYVGLTKDTWKTGTYWGLDIKQLLPSVFLFCFVFFCFQFLSFVWSFTFE